MPLVPDYHETREDDQLNNGTGHGHGQDHPQTEVRRLLKVRPREKKPTDVQWKSHNDGRDNSTDYRFVDAEAKRNHDNHLNDQNH